VSDWLEWQIVDSAFPTGLFAHSWGLESAWQHGEVESFAAVQAFVDAAVVQAGYATLPFLNEAFNHPERLEALDALAEAFLTNHVANRASRVQGRTLVATAARVWPDPGVLSLHARVDTLHAHVAPLSGAVFKALKLRLGKAQRMVLYSTARGVLASAVRLGIIGSFEAQRLQASSASSLDRVATRCTGVSITDLAQTAPVIDILQSAHDRLYSRLFQS
jgi:urease accessory protein